MMAKYNTYTNEEEYELRKKVGYDDDSDEFFSLKYHVEKRKSMEELGVNIPLYLNKGQEFN
jgi:hypothetical protein